MTSKVAALTLVVHDLADADTPVVRALVERGKVPFEVLVSKWVEPGTVYVWDRRDD